MALQVLEAPRERIASAAALACVAVWMLASWMRKRLAADAQAEQDLSLQQARETQPASVIIGRLRRSEAAPVALDALSKLLSARPSAVRATVIWLDAGQHRTAPRSTLSFDRSRELLIVTRDDCHTHAIMTDEAGVHHFASIGKIDTFGVSN